MPVSSGEELGCGNADFGEFFTRIGTVCINTDRKLEVHHDYKENYSVP